MKMLAACAAALCFVGAAAAQRSSSSEAALVQELKGLAAPRARTADALKADYEKAVRYLLARMGEQDGSSRWRLTARDDLEAICLRAGRPGAETERAALCGVLSGLLGAEAETPRGVILRMLEYIGRGECAGAVARLLADKDAPTRERARRALEANPSREAADKLRQALYQAVRAEDKVALINSLGARRDAGSVDWLGRLLKDKDPDVALAAASALGRIGGPEAIRVLNDVRLLAMHRQRLAVVDALFACAEQAEAAGDAEAALTIYRKTYENPLEPQRTRIAALRRMVALQPQRATGVLAGMLSGTDQAILPVALELAREVPGEAATQVFAALLPKTRDVERAIALVELLGARADHAGRQAVLEAMRARQWRREDRQRLRIAAIQALGGAGTEADALMLAQLATQTIAGKEEERKLARQSLQQLKGPKVNAAILAALGEGDTAVRVELVRALGVRKAAEAVPRLLELSGEREMVVRHAALEALSQLADEKALPVLVRWMSAARESQEVYLAERAIVQVCSRSERKEAAVAAAAESLKGASVQARCALMRICGRLGGAQAIELLARGVEDPEETVREMAVRAMAQSPDLRAAEQLLKIARTAAKEEDKLLALRGYIRLMRYVERPPEKMLWMYIQVLDLATRGEEKKLALAGLGDIKNLGAMTLAMEHLDNKELRPTAETTVCRVGRHLYEEHPAEVVRAMGRVLSVTENEQTAKEAQRILDLAKQHQKPPAKAP